MFSTFDKYRACMHALVSLQCPADPGAADFMNSYIQFMMRKLEDFMNCPSSRGIKIKKCHIRSFNGV